MVYIELRLAALAAGVAPPPPLTVLRFADMSKFRTTDYDWYLAINPNGKVPTLCDAETKVTMWDSCAMYVHKSIFS
jgi:glutathione S-transferase